MNKTVLLLIGCSSLTFFIGLMMVFNATSAEVLNRSLNISTHFALIKQLVYGIFGIIVGYLVWLAGYHKIVKISPILFFGSVVFLILVFIPKIGITINGARRWIGFSGLTLQPSEFVKFIIPVFFINYIMQRKEVVDWKSFLRMIAIFSVPICLILLEPDTGTTIIILITLVIMFFLMKIKILYWFLPLFVITCTGGLTAYNMPHVKNRIKIYLHPELDLMGRGHQPYQAKIAVGSGKFLGRGIGESLQKLDYLPEARSDYIVAIYAEEVGFVGIMLLIALYMCITYAGFSIAIHASDKKGFYLAGILTFLIAFQAFLNLGVVSGLLPSKGITLPFFSQGGTSLIVNIIAIFLLLSVAQKTKLKKCKR